MIVVFMERYLQVMYERGRDDKKHRYQPDIIKRYRRAIDYLKSARRIEDLYTISSLNYKVLEGDKRGISAVRVNDQYRLEFRVEMEGEPRVTICKIEALTNHYKR